MDREKLEKLARLSADKDELECDITSIRIARSETQNPVIDKMLLARLTRKLEELRHVGQNIEKVKKGEPEIEWHETDIFDDLGPEDGVPFWH
jgi:hypothetical protein